MVPGGWVQPPGSIDGLESNVHTWRLAIKSFSPGDNCNISGHLDLMHLAIRVVPPGGICSIRDF